MSVLQIGFNEPSETNDHFGQVYPALRAYRVEIKDVPRLKLNKIKVLITDIFLYHLKVHSLEIS